jgi:mono/diheme cytochrome c family protein
MGLRIVAACVLFATALGGSPVLALAQDDDRLANDMPVPVNDPTAVEAGHERFGERCVFCHGGGGKGAKGPCLTCGRFRNGGKASQIYGAIANGIWGTQMGAFGNSLSREEILNIIAYLRVHTEQRRQAGELE